MKTAKDFFGSVRWFIAFLLGADRLTATEIHEHIDRLRVRRERLGEQRMALSNEIVYWQSVVRKQVKRPTERGVPYSNQEEY